MKIPSFVKSLRSLMLAILVVAVACGLLAYQRNRERRRIIMAAQLKLQDALTAAIVRDFGREFSASATRGRGGAGSSDLGWNLQLQMRTGYGPATRDLIDLEIRGGSDDLKLKPIELEDRGADHNARIFELLGREYRARGWEYRVVPVPMRQQ